MWWAWLVLVPLLLGPQGTQSDGSAKDEPKAPKKVYTDDDLGRYRPPAPSPPPSSAPTGGARSSRAKRATTPQPTPPPPRQPPKGEWTGDQDAEPPRPLAPVEDPGASPDTQQAPAPDGTEGESGEAAWRARADASRLTVLQVENQVEGLQYRLDGLRNDTGLDRATDPFRLQKIQAEIEQVTADLEQAKTQLQATRKALEDFEEEARRANVPPGWLRERPSGPES